jgi:hypothetical protein
VLPRQFERADSTPTIIASTQPVPSNTPNKRGFLARMRDRFGRTPATGFGSLDPSGSAIELTPELSTIVGDATARLSITVMNRTFNPFRDSPLVGPYKDADEVFEGKAFVPVRALVTGTIGHGGAAIPDPVKPLLAALSEVAVLRTPAQKFRIGEEIGNRIVFYGGATGMKDIDALTHELGKRHLRLLKVMGYFHQAGQRPTGAPASVGVGPMGGDGSQGGTPAQIAAQANSGLHHAGGFSAGYDASGKPVAVQSDWPDGYGAMNDPTYNAHIIAIDYQGGVRDRIPDATLAAYKRNADMWDCCAGSIVPFAGGDPDQRFTNYAYNPLDAYDQKSLLALAQELAVYDKQDFIAKFGAFYCSEGQFTVANLGPQDATLLKKSKYGNTAWGQRIDNFQAAPGYRNMSVEQRRQKPDIGWKYLVSLGPRNGGISKAAYDGLRGRLRTAVALEWIPEDVRGWQAYGPINPEALIARPMTVATLAWSLFRRYLPIDGVSRLIVKDILRVNQSGSAQAKAGVRALAGGQDPLGPEGQKAIGGFAIKCAVGLLLGLLSNDGVKAGILKQAGYEEITNEPDKQQVQRAYAEFLETLKNADFTSQEKLDRTLFEADERLAKLSFEQRHLMPGRVGEPRKYLPVRKSLMIYAAPTCLGIWAQHPLFAQTNCFRYVATAMHAQQRKAV